MNEFYLQRPQNFVTDPSTGCYGHERSLRTVCSSNTTMKVPMPESRNGWGRAGSYPSSPDAMIQVSSQVFNVQKLVKSHYEDRFMQHSRKDDREERDELVKVEPRSTSRFPEF